MPDTTKWDNKDIALFRSWVDAAGQGGIVFLGGAGVSTESGIPDFRSSSGVFSGSRLRSPEELVSRSFFRAHPQEFFEFYKGSMLFPDALPNTAHKKLAELEAAGLLRAVITQNIDGLHQAAGSKNVLELHGSVHRNYCVTCKKSYSLDFVMASEGVPQCTACGGMVRPDVVLYEEPLDERILEEAVLAIEQASMMIIAGTSLVVYPAAGLTNYFKGSHLVLINKSPTSQDEFADLCIAENVGSVFDW